jgi:hypothetical protein
MCGNPEVQHKPFSHSEVIQSVERDISFSTDELESRLILPETSLNPGSSVLQEGALLLKPSLGR